MATPFRESVQKSNASAQSISSQRAALDELFAHMYDISDDPAGSDPHKYMSVEEAEMLAEFVEYAKAEDWRGSLEIEMRRSRIRNLPVFGPMNGWKNAWNSSRHTAKAMLTEALLFPVVEGSETRGYIVGTLSFSPTQAVAICKDGLLRSRRGPELQKSKGIGWGRLPDIEKIRPVFGVGRNQGLYFGSKALPNVLVSKIPSREDS